MQRWTRGIVLLAVLMGCIGCDRMTKRLAVEVLRDAPLQSFWGDTFRLQYAENPGGFLGLGGSLSREVRHWLLTVANGGLLLGLAGILVVYWNRLSAATFLANSLVLSGGIGNFLDRCLHDGHVIDFLNLGLGPIRSGIFNVADVAITAGGLLWLSRHLLQRPAE
jgi:signal peptidase II